MRVLLLPQFLKAALSSFGFSPSQFLQVESVEEDRQSFQRTIWRTPADVDALFDVDGDNGEKVAEAERHKASVLSTLAGMDRHVLPKEYTEKEMRVEIWWRSKVSTQCPCLQPHIVATTADCVDGAVCGVISAVVSTCCYPLTSNRASSSHRCPPPLVRLACFQLAVVSAATSNP